MISVIKDRIEKNRERIEKWFDQYYAEVVVPVYVSVDLRESRHKIAVVDTNVFPAGFNNLCPNYLKQLPDFFREYLDAHYAGAQKILLFPEHHTRNKYYLENIKTLKNALVEAGYQVVVGSADPDLRDDQAVLPAIEGELTLARMEKNDGVVSTRGFVPDLVLSNNDFTGGRPEILSGLSIPVIPAPGLGWHRRRKHAHFEILNRLTAEFAPVAGLDAWCISTHAGWLGDVDINDSRSRDRLADRVDMVIEEIKKEYELRGLDERPFVFIKNNAGTYGIAVMTALSGDEVRQASHKTRAKMSTGKSKTPVREFFIQEGIPTRHLLDQSPMEPVIYMVGGKPAGGFYRLHKERSQYESLNVRGMEFRRLCFHQVAGKKPESLEPDCHDAASLLLIYGTLARLAALAVGLENTGTED